MITIKINEMFRGKNEEEKIRKWRFAENLKRIITPAADVQEAIRMQEQTAAQEKEQYRSAGFSAKNQTVAVVLSALLMLYGAPFFYIGKPLWGILCLLVSILSTVLGLFPLMFLIVLGGMVFAILIGAGKVKDKDGKYIVSEKQKQSLLHGER